MIAGAFSICLGLGHGFFAIARNTLPLMLFGAREYGTYMGRLMLPQNIANAAAPIIFAIADRALRALDSAVACGSSRRLTGLVAVILLVRTCRGHR